MLINTQAEVAKFLHAEFSKILTEPVKQEAISGNLFYETRDERFNLIIEKLKTILSNGI